MRLIGSLQRLALFAALSAMAPALAHAQAGDFPDRPLRMVIPWPAGGITDVAGRVVAQQLGVQLGQSVVVENRPGASGRIGMQAAPRTTPDGYTIFLGNGASMSVLGAVDPSLSYDPLKDFAPIALLSESPVGLLTPADLAPNNLKEFIALAKAEPKKLTFSSPGTASTFHLLTELFLARTGE
jgi:tripartite-type tricarboxylate transporter receptor subunit TctC